MNSSLSPSLCLHCNGENSPDSKFCRHCGLALEGAKNGAAPKAVAALTTADLVDTAGVDAQNEALSSPGEIDARRAQQLLDRALYLSERGDVSGAILASRQSIALAPALAEGHALLGQLLERSGDMAHAAAAYEKATQLAPDSALERENLERVQEKLQSQHLDTQFRFDDAELFADTNGSAADPAEAAVGGAPFVAPDAASAGVKSGDYSLNVRRDEPNAASVPLAATQGTSQAAPKVVPPASKATPPVVFERRVSQRRRFNTPITVERRSHVDRRVPVRAVQPVMTPAPAVPSAVAPVFQAPVAAPAGAWGTLWSRPSYFGRSLPLAGITVLALGLLSLARNAAVARAVDAQNNATVAIDPPSPAPPTAPIITPSSGLPPLTPSQSQNGGFPISNRPAAPVAAAPNRPATSNPPRLAAAPRANTAPRAASAPNRAPRVPQIPPAAIPPARASSNPTGSDSTGSNSGNRNPDPLSLPAPNIPAPQVQAPPVSVLPSGSSPALNPAGASGRGYVRITQGRVGTSALPQRSASQGNNEERNAANASRGGQNDQAIERLSAAINANASDAGYRYQQRATLFLNRGDYSRAADDFQAAMNAYRAQIDRGEQVVAARAGLNSARSGLNLALAGGR